MSVELKKLIRTSILYLSLFYAASSSLLQAQDKEFWFAAPDISEQYGCGYFDSPIVIAISNTTDTEGNVTITMYNGGTKKVIEGIIPAGGLYKYDIPNNNDSNASTRIKAENPRSEAGTVTTYGIHITTTVPVTVYYQSLAPCNQDIWSLKGSTALGTKFYVPMVHDSYYHTGSGYTTPIPYDQIDIVAAEDGTVVTVVPTKAVRIGASGSSPAGTEITKTLNKGQTLKIMEHVTGSTIGSASLAGTKITSTKPIAVTTTEDLIGRTNGGTGWDVIGDQIVPTTSLGNNYVVIKGYLAGSDRAYIVATEDGTTVTINNGSTSTISLNAGGCGIANLGDGGNTGAAPQAISISSNKPIYCYHVSGVKGGGDELGSGLLPSIYSIGQTQLSIYQYFQAGESNYAFIVFRNGKHDKFKIKYGNGSYQSLTVTPINIPGMPDWKAAKITLASTTESRIITLTNSESPFSFGYFSLNTNTGGSSFGFLSAFGDFKFPNYTYKCAGSSIPLNAGYGMSYKWWKGQLADKPTNPADIISTSNQYPASEEGYYTVEINQDSRTVTATTYVKNDVLNLTTTVPTFVKKGDAVNLSASVTRIDDKAFSWNLGAGADPATSTAQNPTGVKWNSTGSKTVGLTVSFSILGCPSESKNHTVLVYDIQDDYSQTIKETPVVIDVLANDDFPSCSTPTINVPSSTTKGNISIESGKVKYTPKAGALGNDEFTYTVTCGANTSVTAKVHVYIAEKPDNISDKQCFGTAVGNNFDMDKKFSVGGVNSMSTPMVADLDLDDDHVDIIVPVEITLNSTDPWKGNKLKIINGKTGIEVRTINTVPFYTHGQVITIGDVDRDKKSEIFIMSYNDNKIYCYNHLGNAKEGFTTTVALNRRYLLNLADINSDGTPELVAGPYIFNAITGALLVNGTTAYTDSGLGLGDPHNTGANSQAYYMYALADFDGDGILEMAAGNAFYEIDIAASTFTRVRTANTAALSMSATAIDGQTIAIDFNNDGRLDAAVLGRTATTGNNNTFEIYVWDPLTGEVIARKQYTGMYGQTIPYVGDLDGNGTPEIVFATGNSANKSMIALTYDTSAAGNSAGAKNMRQMHNHAPFGESAGFTVFDFDQDGKVEIVYRGTHNFYIVNGETLALLTDNPIQALSGTVAEYPVVADVDNDGHAEIIITHAYEDWFKPGGAAATGWLSVYGSQTPGAWAPARKVWNQWAYNVVNINEDMTIPRYPLNAATKFPNGKRPFNGFLQQATLLNSDGDLLFLTPKASFEGNPSYTWRGDNNSLEVKVKIKNIGDADLVAPVYATAYKNDTIPANKLGTGSYASNIAPGATGELTITITNISSKLPITDIHIRLNDNGTKYPVQQQCKYDENLNKHPLATLPRAVNDTIQVRSNMLYTDLDILSNDSYSCGLSNLSVSIVSPFSTNAATADVTSKKLDYKSNIGFSGTDKIYYKIQCSGSEDASIAIAHMVIFKPVKVSVLSGLNEASESGTPKAKLRFEFTDGVTHSKNVEVSYTITPDGENEIQTPAPPAPYKVEIPFGQTGIEVELTAKQNYVVQGNRDVTVTITDVKEVP